MVRMLCWRTRPKRFDRDRNDAMAGARKHSGPRPPLKPNPETSSLKGRRYASQPPHRAPASTFETFRLPQVCHSMDQKERLVRIWITTEPIAEHFVTQPRNSHHRRTKVTRTAGTDTKSVIYRSSGTAAFNLTLSHF